MAGQDLRLRVRYAETDQMRVAHHAAYLVWFEAARTECLRALGFSYRQLEENGFYLPVVECFCRYRSSVSYDDMLVVSARVTELTRVKVTISYRASKEDGTLCAEGHTVHALLNREMKPSAFPPDLRAALATDLGPTK